MADVLVVDDDPDVAESVEMLLVSEGHTVRLASNGAEGLAALNERAPDVVLLDVEMPVLDGPSMAYGMIVHDAGLEEIPIVLLSGAVNLTAVARRVGTPYMLSKPFAVDEFLALVARAATERRPPVPTLDGS